MPDSFPHCLLCKNSASSKKENFAFFGCPQPGIILTYFERARCGARILIELTRGRREGYTGTPHGFSPPHEGRTKRESGISRTTYEAGWAGAVPAAVIGEFASRCHWPRKAGKGDARRRPESQKTCHVARIVLGRGVLARRVFEEPESGLVYSCDFPLFQVCAPRKG